MKAYQFKSIIFKTGNANYYVFSQSLGCVLYLHPIIRDTVSKSISMKPISVMYFKV